MKIRIMKREVLDTLKANLETYIKFYYHESNNDWLYSICNCDPFEDYKEISDFELADLSQQAAKIDFENCKIIYSKLSFLSESQACDERLWAGLAHDVFYKYLRERFKMHVNMALNIKNPVGNVLTRFFFNGGVRSGLYRNALSKCWWVGYHTWDENSKSFLLLDKLGSRDFSTKVSDIFYNYSFVNNSNILQGIVEGIYYFNEQKINFDSQKHCRPALQYLNALGGGLILDSLSPNEIKDIIIEQISNRINGYNSIIVDDNELDSIDNNEEEIAVGDSIRFKYLSGSKEGEVSSLYTIAFDKNIKLFPIAEATLGYSKGDIFEVDLQNEHIKGEIIEIIKYETKED